MELEETSEDNEGVEKAFFRGEATLRVWKDRSYEMKAGQAIIASGTISEDAEFGAEGLAKEKYENQYGEVEA